MLKKNLIFDLKQPQLITIQKVKNLITSPPCPKFYDFNQPTRLRPDASSKGLGAVLKQWFPVAFASRERASYESAKLTFDDRLISEARLNQLQQETTSDPVLLQHNCKHVILNGRPEKHDIPPSLKPYYSTRGEIVYKRWMHDYLFTLFLQNNERNYSPRSQWH